MPRSRHTRIIAAIAGAAIFLTAVGAAQADSHKRGNYAQNQAIAAILGLAVVGALVANKHKDRKKAHTSTKSAPPPVHVPHKPQAHKLEPKHYGRAPAHLKPRPLPPRARRHALPSHCIRYFGERQVFSARCLNRHYPQAHALPNACRREIWTDRGPRHVLGKRCLRHNGFQIAQH